METAILPDSSFYIDALRSGIDPFSRLVPGMDEREYATCGMVVLEVCRGLRQPELLRRFRERFATMIYLPTTNAIWERAVQLGWSLDRRGAVLPAPDLLIAASALQAGAAVLTRDAHFRAIPGLQVLDSLGNG